MLEVNALGAVLTAREAVRRMVPVGAGSIVLVGSIASRVGSPNRYVDCAASKGAVDSFVLGLSKEVAAAIVWLLGDESSYVSGTFLDVGGAG